VPRLSNPVDVRVAMLQPVGPRPYQLGNDSFYVVSNGERSFAAVNRFGWEFIAMVATQRIVDYAAASFFGDDVNEDYILELRRLVQDVINAIAGAFYDDWWNSCEEDYNALVMLMQEYSINPTDRFRLDYAITRSAELVSTSKRYPAGYGLYTMAVAFRVLCLQELVRFHQRNSDQPQARAEARATKIAGTAYGDTVTSMLNGIYDSVPARFGELQGFEFFGQIIRWSYTKDGTFYYGHEDYQTVLLHRGASIIQERNHVLDTIILPLTPIRDALLEIPDYDDIPVR
jgi:hypothetical protein